LFCIAYCYTTTRGEIKIIKDQQVHIVGCASGGGEAKSALHDLFALKATSTNTTMFCCIVSFFYLTV